MKLNNIEKRIWSFLLCLGMTLMLLPTGFADEAANTAEETIPGEETETAEEPEEKSDWETRLLLMLQEYNADPDTIGAGYYNFATGEEHYYNGDVYRVSGSMYKVPLNMLFLDWIGISLFRAAARHDHRFQQ